MEKVCKHCNKKLTVEKIQQFAHHVSRCAMNPNSKLTLEKIRNNGFKKSSKTKLTLNCQKCNVQFEVIARPFEIKNNKIKKFCSTKCSNSRKNATYYHCEYCDKERQGFLGTRFCSYKCQRDAEFKNITLPKFEQGLITRRPTIRNVLRKLIGYFCSECKISSWQNKNITLQVDHIDGDAGNNMPANLRLLCPNCHTQTKTFGGRNKGNGRKSKGLSLA